MKEKKKDNKKGTLKSLLFYIDPDFLYVNISLTANPNAIPAKKFSFLINKAIPRIAAKEALNQHDPKNFNTFSIVINLFSLYI